MDFGNLPGALFETIKQRNDEQKWEFYLHKSIPYIDSTVSFDNWDSPEQSKPAEEPDDFDLARIIAEAESILL